MLWAALYLPDLPLQLALRTAERSLPLVITDGHTQRPVVICASREALAAGIKAGMAVAAARAFTAKFTILARHAGTETQALHNLGCWAYQFTSGVVLQSGEGLILEIGSSLQLHGGFPRLLACLRKEILQLGYTAAIGVAPTPTAAWILAKAKQAGLASRPCGSIINLPALLENLPLALLDWPQNTQATFAALGITRIGPCLALPRDGFIKRFGHELRLQLDKLIGAIPDPRPVFTPPDTFQSRVEFGFEVSNAMALLFPLKRLLHELEGFLRGHGAGIQQWLLILEHSQGRRTELAMGVATPERDAERLLGLARERLSNTRLTAPVLAIRITADELYVFEEHSQSWLPDPKRQSIGWAHLVDKLTARLGAEKIYRLRSRDGHRPEHCWQKVGAMDAPGPPSPPICSARPLWLLKSPRLLALHQDVPNEQGPLQFIAGPERIESGWWDGKMLARDYFVARNPQGATYWIFREHRRDQQWYLHGVFA